MHALVFILSALSARKDRSGQIAVKERTDRTQL